MEESRVVLAKLEVRLDAQLQRRLQRSFKEGSIAHNE